jgi:indolepyruvate ferredoxin oxidoreductase
VHPVQTEFGRKTRISQSSCNLDYSCLEGDCPSFVTVRAGVGGAGPQAARRVLPPPLGTDELPAPDPVPPSPDGAFRMRITGIGGTGIVTVAQILATAAVIEGREVRALDQTGLAQKGGAVVSDLTVTGGPVEQASKLGEGRCDLYLGCDALVAADPGYLKTADPGRTVAVVSSTEVPTGQMVVDTSVAFPGHAQVDAAVGPATARACYLDAGAIARQAFDDEQYANLVLAGAAYQSGALPVGAAAIERAIELNGVAAEANIQAFRRGRQALARPGELAAALAPREAGPPTAPSAEPPAEPPAAQRLAAVAGAPPGSALAGLVLRRVADLIGYQDEGYARQYADFVGQVLTAEQAATPGETVVTEAVARNLHKLMAYKDEYEVARLALDPAFGRQVAAEFGPDSKITYRLHPPLLRAMGVRHKIALGPWFGVAFRGLRAMRGLRGTPADVFGHTKVRRLERQLAAEYRDSVTGALGRLRPENAGLVARIAELPDMIRGYEQIKLDNVARYRAELGTLQAELAQAPAAAGHTG